MKRIVDLTQINPDNVGNPEHEHVSFSPKAEMDKLTATSGNRIEEEALGL